MPSAAAAWHDPDLDETRELYLLAGLPRQPLIAVFETATLSELRAIFCELRTAAIAVVDDTCGLRGLITRTDVLRALDTPTARAADVMSAYVLVLPADATVECAAALMATEDVGQIAMVDGRGELVGLVSALDVARHLATRAGYLPG